MKTRMRAMIMEHCGAPLRMVDLPVPQPGTSDVLIEVEACGVCRTDLHRVEASSKERQCRPWTTGADPRPIRSR